MTLEKKAILAEIKAVDGKKGLVIEGWANKAIVDRGGDIIPQSAWNLENFNKNPIILFNHDRSQPIGRATVIEARDEGLYVKAKISQSETPEITRIRDLIKEGVINAFSVGIDVKSEAKNADGVNEIKQAELFEVSVVAIPMNQDSTFTLTKSYDFADFWKTVKSHTDGLVVKADEGSEEEAQVSESEASSADLQGDLARATKVLPAKDQLSVEVQALCFPKDQYSLDEAKSIVEEFGWSSASPTEEEDVWCFNQSDAGAFLSLAEMALEAGIYAVVGAKIEPPESEDEPTVEIEVEASKSITTPLPDNAPQVSESEAVYQAKQTNILLGVMISEMQKLQQLLVAQQNAQTPQMMPDVQPQEDLSKEVEFVREYLANINKTLSRIGA